MIKDFGLVAWARLGVTALGCLAVSAGCVRRPQVATDDLPLRRIVVYRNGVAYFERAGTVEGERVEFRLRQENVGDFLATLAIMERGGSSVRAASFPVEIDEEDGPSPEVQAALDAWERHDRGGDPRKLRRVTLELDGGEHELAVGYLAETPLWRPSYRLVVHEDGQADLQAWGIVQNQSGEDWKNVQIALVAGAPIAFESTLGTPVTPPRPIVSDSGEMIAAVPGGVTSYGPEEAETEEGKPRAPGAPQKKAAAPSLDESMAESMADDGVRRERQASRAGAAPAPAPPPMPVLAAPSAPRDLSRLAAVQVQTGTTRYEIPHTVTIPDQSATMILLMNQRVPGEAVYLYAPDGGVPDSTAHPFRVARFTNASAGLLERGPIAVFEKGAFLGQGVVESLPSKAHATVPFALVRALGVRRDRKHDQRGARLYSVESGTLEVERDQATLTTYEVKNGLEQPAKLLVRHLRAPGAELFQPPKGTEDDAAQGHALVPLEIPARGKAKLVVEERQPMRQVTDWLSPVAADAVAAYLKDAASDATAVQQLRTAFVVRGELQGAADRERKLQREQGELEKASRETRLSLQAIEKNPQAGDLRTKLTRRLADATSRLDQITKELIEVRMRMDEQQVRFRDAVLSIRVVPRR